jgi:hypothetical protein
MFTILCTAGGYWVQFSQKKSVMFIALCNPTVRTAFLKGYERGPWSDSCRSGFHNSIDSVGGLRDQDQEHATIVGKRELEQPICTELAQSLRACLLAVLCVHSYTECATTIQEILRRDMH